MLLTVGKVHVIGIFEIRIPPAPFKVVLGVGHHHNVLFRRPY